jgi:pyrroline-5-carboxylate reductase
VNAVVFLGGGRITSALTAGLRRGGYRGALVVHDRHPAKLRKLTRQYGVKGEPDIHRAVAQARLLIIAVRPGSVAELLAEIRPIDRPLTAVSLAAGIPLATLRDYLQPPVRWARAMPSPVCRTGCGLTALTFHRALPANARRELRDLFARVGTILEIPEKRLDTFTVTYSSSHGYHALEALAASAMKLGLDRRTAFVAAAHALADGIISWRQGEVPLKDLLHEAATPGGIAAAVMNAMNSAGYRYAVERGLQAGLERARTNLKSSASKPRKASSLVEPSD